MFVVHTENQLEKSARFSVDDGLTYWDSVIGFKMFCVSFFVLNSGC
jgi:hypothetical protein